MQKKLLNIGILTFSSLIVLPTIISCNSAKNTKTILPLAKNNHKLDAEGFPIHPNTELVKGEGDLSVGRVATHLKKYLTIPNDGSKIKKLAFFELFGETNLWKDFYLDKISFNTKIQKYESKWNLGHPAQKWDFIKNNNWHYNGKKYKNNPEYWAHNGWKRFFKNEYKKMRWNKLKKERDFVIFEVRILVYPLLSDPTKLSVKFLIIDHLYKKTNNKLNIKIVKLGEIHNIKQQNFKQIKGTQQQAINPSKTKKAIKNLFNFPNWEINKVINFYIGKNVTQKLIQNLSYKKHKTFIDENIDKIYNLFVNSPYIDINEIHTLKNKDIIEFMKNDYALLWRTLYVLIVIIDLL